MTDANSSNLPPVVATIYSCPEEPSPFRVALKKARANSPDAVALREAIRTNPHIGDFKGIVRASRRVKDKPLPSAKATLIASRRVTDLGLGLTVICPITGLVVPSDLPPFLGMVLSSYHPMTHNALAILDLPHYLETLSLEQQCALILASLAALDKLDLQDSSLIVLTCLENALLAGQARVFLNFIDEAVRRTTRHYPKLTLDRTVDEHTLLSYMIKCVEVENYAGDADWREANPLLANKGQPVITKAPEFLSSQKSGRKLDKACYEAWLEVAPYLPKSMVSKAAPFIKTLASNLDSRTIERMAEAVLNYCLEDSEAALYAVEFKTTLEANRKSATSLGLHRDYLDLDLALPDLSGDEPEDLAFPSLDAPAPALEALGAAEAPSHAPAKPGSFAARLAAHKAAQAAKTEGL